MPLEPGEKELLDDPDFFRPTPFGCPKCGSIVIMRVFQYTETPLRLHCTDCPWDMRRVINRKGKSDREKD